jgi:hypothetical protein
MKELLLLLLHLLIAVARVLEKTSPNSLPN